MIVLINVFLWSIYSSLGWIMLVLLFYFHGFSAEKQSGVAIKDIEVPVLEDVTDKEGEGMSASESKKATSKESKLKGPRK